MKSRYAMAVISSLLLTFGVGAAQRAGAAQSADCAPDGQLQFLCGPVNAEDLVQVGSSRWLIASGMDGVASGGSAPARGHLYLIDHLRKSWQVAFPGEVPAFRYDRRLYGNCPGPLDAGNFSAHGLALRAQSRGRFRLYVVGHGGREAIEIFEVDARGRVPAVTWIGCVLLPDHMTANGVAILPDWGFVATKFLDRSLPQAQSMAAMREGKPNGALFEWHPGGAVAALPGSELSAPNGIEVSRDGRILYVAVTGTRELVRFIREGDGLRKDAVGVAISPDNLRWSAAGKLLTVGSDYAGPGAPRSGAWTLLEVDPETLATRAIAKGTSSRGMQALSVGLPVAGEIWMGTYAGDRVGYLRWSN